MLLQFAITHYAVAKQCRCNLCCCFCQCCWLLLSEFFENYAVAISFSIHCMFDNAVNTVAGYAALYFLLACFSYLVGYLQQLSLHCTTILACNTLALVAFSLSIFIFSPLIVPCRGHLCAATAVAHATTIPLLCHFTFFDVSVAITCPWLMLLFLQQSLTPVADPHLHCCHAATTGAASTAAASTGTSSTKTAATIADAASTAAAVQILPLLLLLCLMLPLLLLLWLMLPLLLPP